MAFGAISKEILQQGGKIVDAATSSNQESQPENFIYSSFQPILDRHISTHSDQAQEVQRHVIKLLDTIRNFGNRNPAHKNTALELIKNLTDGLSRSNIFDITDFNSDDPESLSGLNDFINTINNSGIEQYIANDESFTEISRLLLEAGEETFNSQQTLLTLKGMEESMRMINGLTDSSSFDRYNNSLLKLFSTLLDKKDVTIFEDVNKTINDINQKMTQMNHDFSQDVWETATKTEIDAQISQLDDLANQVSHLHDQATTMLNSNDIQDLSMDNLIGVYNQFSKLASAGSFVSDSVTGIINTNTQLTQNEKQELIEKCKRLSFQNNKTFAIKFANILHDKISQRLSEITSNKRNNLRQISNISGLGAALNSNVRASGQAATNLAQATYTYKETRKARPLFSFGLSSSMKKLHDHASLISQLEMEYNQASATIDKIQSQAEEAFAEGNFEKGKTLMDAYKKQMGSLVNLVENLGTQAETLANTYNSLSKKEKESLSPDFRSYVQTVVRSQSDSARNILVQIEGLGLNINTRRLKHFSKLADHFEEYNKELDKHKDKPTNYLQEIRAAYNEARGIIHSIQSFHRTIFDTFGLGTVSLGPISVAQETFNYSVEQGRKRYASMSADAFMGVNDLEASAQLAQEQMLASNELYRMSGGRISQYAIRDSYEHMVRNMGTPPGISPEQRREDMNFFANNTVLLQNVYGIDQSTITNGLQFFYRDMRMSANQAANSFAKLTQQAISANVPIDQYLSTFNDLAKQYMTIGITGDRAGIVLDKLARNHLRIDIAKEVASQLGQAMSNFAQDKNKVAFAAARLGEDPFHALAQMAYTHDEKGDPREAWIDEITKYADSLVDAYAPIAGGNDDIKRMIYTDLYKSFGFDKRSTSILLDELFKNGNTSQFKELFKKEFSKIDNPNATIEDLNAKALQHLIKMSGVLAQADKTEAELKSNLFRQARHFGSVMDNLLQAFAPLLLTLQGLVLEVTAKIVDWLKEMVSSDLFSQGIEHVKEALKHLPTIFGAFFGFIFLRKIGSLVFSLARAVLGPAAVLIGAAIKNPKIALPLAGLAAIAGIITNKDSITQSIKNFELPSIELPSFADINIDDITKKFSFFNKSEEGKSDRVEDSTLDSVISSVKNINILDENSIFNEKTVNNVKKELNNISNTITDFRYKLYSKDTDRQDIQAIRAFTNESYMQEQLEEYNKDEDINSYDNEQYKQAVDTINSYRDTATEESSTKESPAEESPETVVLGVYEEINPEQTNSMIINQQIVSTENINQQFINTENINNQFMNIENIDKQAISQTNIRQINQEIIDKERNVQEINRQQKINQEYINDEQINKQETTNRHNIDTINTYTNLYNFDSYVNEFTNIAKVNKNQYNTEFINKTHKNDIERINRIRSLINGEKVVNNYAKTFIDRYNKSILYNDNKKYISNSQKIKDSYNINSRYMLNTDWLNKPAENKTANIKTLNDKIDNKPDKNEYDINQNNIDIPSFNEYNFDQFKFIDLQLEPLNLLPITSPTQENTSITEATAETVSTEQTDQNLSVANEEQLTDDKEQIVSNEDQLTQIARQTSIADDESQQTDEAIVLGIAQQINQPIVSQNIISYPQQVSNKLDQYTNNIINQYTDNSQYDVINQYDTNIYETDINEQFNFNTKAADIIQQNITNTSSNTKIMRLKDKLHNLYSTKSEIVTNINETQDTIDLINIDLSNTDKNDAQYNALLAKLDEYTQQFEQLNKRLNKVQGDIDKTQENLVEEYDQYQTETEQNLNFNSITTAHDNFATDTQNRGDKLAEQIAQDYQNTSDVTKNSLAEAHNIAMTSIDSTDEQITDHEIQVLSSANTAMDALSTGMIEQAKEQAEEKESAEKEAQAVAGVSSTEAVATDTTNANAEATEMANETDAKNVPSAKEMTEQKTPEQKVKEEQKPAEEQKTEANTEADKESQKMMEQLSDKDIAINEDDSPEVKRYKKLLQEAMEKDKKSKEQIEQLTKDNDTLKETNKKQAKYIADQNTAKDSESEEYTAAQTNEAKQPDISRSMGDFRRDEEKANQRVKTAAKVQYLQNSDTYHPAGFYNFSPKTKLPPPKESEVTAAKIIQSISDSIKFTPTKKIYSPIVGSIIDKQNPYAPVPINYSKHEFNVPDIFPTLKPENIKNIESNYGNWDFNKVQHFKSTSINNTGYGIYYIDKFVPGEKSQEDIEREKKKAEKREQRETAINEYIANNPFISMRYGQNMNMTYKVAGTTQEEIKNILSKYTNLPKKTETNYEELRKQAEQRTNYNDWGKIASKGEVSIGIGTNNYKPIEKTPEIIEKEKTLKIQELQKEKQRLQDMKINTSFTGYTFGLSEAERAAKIKYIDKELEKLGVKPDKPDESAKINIEKDIQEFERILTATKQIIATPKMQHLDDADIYKKREQRLKDKYVDEEIESDEETDEESKNKSEESRQRQAKKLTNKIVSEQYKEQLLAKSTYDLLLEFMDLDSSLFQDLNKSIANEHLQLLYMNNVTNDILKLIDTSVKKAGQIITKVAQGGTGKLAGGAGGIQSGAEPQFKSTGNKLGDIATFAHYWTKQKYGKDLPAFFTRALLRNEAGINLDASGFARDLHNYGGLKYEKWMAEYGVTEFRDEKVPEGRLGLAKFPDDATFVKVWTELYMGPQAYSEYQEAAALAAQGKFREAAEKHAFMYVAGGNPEQWQKDHPNDNYEQVVSRIEQILKEEYERNSEFGENGLTYQYVPASNAPTGKVDITNNPKHYVDLSSGQIANTSPDTQRFIYAVANAWHKMHPELDPLEITSTLRHGDGSSYHDHGAAFDVANAYFDDKQLRVDYVNLIASLGGTPLDEWEGEPGAIYAHGNNIHATTPNAKSVEGGQFNAPTTVAGAFMIINPDGTIVTNVDTDTDADENAAFINPEETNKLKTDINKAEEEIPTIVLGVYQENEEENKIEESVTNILQLNNAFYNIIMNLLQQDISINPQSILKSLKSYQPQSSPLQKLSNNAFMPSQSFMLDRSFIPDQSQENIFTNPNKSIDNIYTILNNWLKLFNINEQMPKIIAEQSIETDINNNKTDINEINNNIINSLLLTNNYTIFNLLRNYIFLSQNISEHYLEKDINTIYNTIINQYNNEDIEKDEDIYQDIIEHINTQDKINANVYLPDMLKFINYLYINDTLNTTFLQDLTINQFDTKSLSNLIKALPNIRNSIAKNYTIKDLIPSETIEKINTDNILEVNEINKNETITDIPQTDKSSPRREKLNRDTVRKKYKNKLLQLMADEINKQRHIKKIDIKNKAQAKKIKQLSNLEQLLNIFTLFDNDNLLNTIIPSENTIIPPENKITNVLGTQFILLTENKRSDSMSELFNIESILNLSQNIELIPNSLSNTIKFISQIFNNKYNQTNRKHKITEDTNIYNTNTVEEENISTDEKIIISNITDINAIDINTINNDIINNNLSSNISKLLLSPLLTYMPQILQLIRSSFFNQQIINKPQTKPLTSILRSIFKNIFIPSRSNIIQQSITQFTDILNTYINELINDQTMNELISEIDDNNDDDNNIDNISRITKLLNQQLIKSIINLINTDKFVNINEFIPTNIYNTNNIEKTSAQIKKSDTNISIVNKLLNAIKNDSQIINTADKLINTIKKKDIKNIFNKSISSTDILEQINTLIQYINNNNITDNQSLRNNLFRELFKEDTSELPINSNVTNSNATNSNITNSNTTNLFDIFNLLSSIDIKNIFEQKHQNIINEPGEKNEVINNFLLQFINMLHEYDDIINANYDLYAPDKDTSDEDIFDKETFDEETFDKDIFDEEAFDEEPPTAVLGVYKYTDDETGELPTTVLGVKYINDEAEDANNITPNLYPTQTTDAFLDTENILDKEEFINTNILQQFTNIPSNNISSTDIFPNKSSLYDFNYTNNFYNNFNKNINANISMNPILDINKIINNNFTNNLVNNISGINNSILVENKFASAKNTNVISDNIKLPDIKSKDNIQAKSPQNINTDTDILSNTPLNKAKSRIKSEFNNSTVLSSSMNLDNNKQISSIRTLESQQNEFLSAMSKHTDTLHAELKQLNDEYISDMITHNIEEKSRINNITNTYNKNIKAIQQNSIERIKALTKKMQEAVKDFVDDYTATHPSASKAELEQVRQQFIYRNVNIPVTITTVNDDLLSKIKQLCKEQFAEYEDIQEQLALILKDYYDAKKVRQVLDEYRNKIRRPQENIEDPGDNTPPGDTGKPDQYIS